MNGYSIGFAASLPVVLGVIALALGIAVWSYRRTSPPVSSRRRWLLTTLRTIGVGLLLLLLFDPVLTFVGTKVENPSVLIAVDESASMTLEGFDSVRSHEARAIVDRLRSSKIAGSSTWLAFGDSATPLRFPLIGDTLRANRVATRLDAVVTAAADSLRTHNVRAVLMLTDGRYTAGSNPLLAAERLGVPVFAVGFGDSVEPGDLSVQAIVTNDLVYTGTEVPVEVRIRSVRLGTLRADVTLAADGKVLDRKSVEIGPDETEQTLSFAYRPDREGVIRLRADVAPVAGELTRNNNARSVFVRVKSERRSYLVLAGGPGPVLAFIRRKLESEPNVTVSTYVGRADGRFVEGELPATALARAETIVLIDFPTSSTPDGVIRSVADAMGTGRKAIFAVGGNRVDASRLGPLLPLLPFRPGTPRSGERMVTARVTPIGRTSPVTQVSDTGAWSDLPPIYQSETPWYPSADAEVLLSVRGEGADRANPLVVSRATGESRAMAILGYGIYRWQLLGEGTAVERGESPVPVLDRLLGNVFRWLSASNDSRRVRVVAEKPTYSQGETVRLIGQVYNQSDEPLSDAHVTAIVRGQQGASSLTLAPVGNGRYEAVVGEPSAGDYTVEGTADLAGRAIGRDASGFTVGDLGPEFSTPAMDAPLLRELATRTGGRFYTSRSASRLIDDITDTDGFAPRSVEVRSDTRLWQLPWFLAAAIFCFATEWFIRKRSGMV